MGAKQNVHWIKNGHRPKGKKKGRRRKAAEQTTQRTGRFYAGQTEEQVQGGQSTTVVCAPEKEKKKFPWGTILLTGVVTTVGAIVAYKGYERLTSEKKSGGGDEVVKLNPSHQSVLDAKNLLLLTAPGAARMSQFAPALNNPAMAQAMMAGAAAMPPQPPPQPKMSDEEILSYMDQFVQQYDEE